MTGPNAQANSAQNLADGAIFAPLFNGSGR